MSHPPGTKIFVGRLPDACTAEDLRPLFEKYGQVTECDVLTRYGFVHMSTAEEAKAAIEALNGEDLNGSRISVEASTGRRNRGGGGGPMRRGSGFRGGGYGGDRGGGYSSRGGYGSSYSRGGGGYRGAGGSYEGGSARGGGRGYGRGNF